MTYSPVMIAVAMVLGVATANIIDSIYVSMIISCAAVFAVIFFFVISIRRRHFNLFIILPLIGFFISVITCTLAENSYFNTLTSFTMRYVTIEGTVLKPAYENSYDDNYKYTVNVTKIEAPEGVFTLDEKIAFTSPVKFSCGDNIKVEGFIKDIQKQMNENGADMQLYYKSLGVFTRIYSEKAEKIGEEPWYMPNLFSGRFTELIDGLIYRVYSGDKAAVLSAVLTGNNHHFSEEFEKVINVTAFKRHFHPGYLHVTIIFFFFGLISTRVRKNTRDFIMIAVFLIYAMLDCGVGFSKCMALAGITVLLRSRCGTAYYPDVIAWLIIACGINSPLIIFNSGFIMSVTASILIWMFRSYLISHLWFIPKQIRNLTAIITICNIGLWPLTAYFFNGFCIYSIFLPFIMLPLIMLVIITAPAVLIMEILISQSFIPGIILEWALAFIIKIPYFIESLPLSSISVAAPDVVVILISVFIAASLYYFINNNKLNSLFCSALAVGFLLSKMIAAVMTIGTTEFMFVNVGQGDGSVVHTAFGETIIIDGGGGQSYSDYNPGEKIFVPYIRSKGYNIIDAAFVSHYHKDHVQGVISAINSLMVKTVYAPMPENYSDEMMGWVKELENAARENGSNIVYVSDDMTVTFKGGLNVDLYVSNPLQKLSDDENDKMMVIKASYGNFSVLYSGDITEFGEYAFLKGNKDISADVLKVAHHGSMHSTSEEWVKAVSPKCAVISCGENNPFGHPHKSVIERLDGVNVFRTDQRGDITFNVNSKGSYRVKTFE